MRALGLTGLLLFSASVAQAAPNRTGVDMGVRIGYAVPFGDLDGSRGSLAGWVSGAVPVLIEAGYRFDQHVTVGPYFQFAFAQVKDNTNTGCGNNSDCSGWIVRAGVQGLYHLDVASVIVPWFGLGLGYEWTSYSGTIGNVGFSGNASGWEFVNLQVGGDFPLQQGMAVGPFIGFSIARYGSISGSLGNLTASPDVSNPALHEWLQFGARFVFSL
ncbi:MAG TPA: outer membrane beta-barrel protein [Polyangia bacterium]|nr:outer membrane beta-barrel protein [Polyangia bacterium]